MKVEIQFKNWDEAGKMVVNGYWLEYILNLFHQGYLDLIWNEIMDTKINLGNMIESVTYGTLGNTL